MIRSNAPMEYRSGGSRIESHSEVRSVHGDAPVEYRSGGVEYRSGGGEYRSGGGEYRSGGGEYRSGGGEYRSGGGEYRSGGGAYDSQHGEVRMIRNNGSAADFHRPPQQIQIHASVSLPPPGGNPPNSPMQIRLAENREIGALNDRHADYISEVRFLQAVHRKLKMRLDQWMKAGKPGYGKESITEHIANGNNGYGKLKERYDADAEKIPSLNIELNNTRSRYESALRGRDPSAEDSLLVRLCDVRSQICLAKGRGKVIQEECQRLRKENQKLMDDIASQRQIFDKETQERHSYERRAVPLLRECEELLKKCKLGSSGFASYSFDDIEKDRKQFRAGVEASMGDIRRQYEILASTVNSEMEQWYKQQINGIDIKRREDASSYKKKLADLRAELVDVRTKLAHLEERNRLLTSLIGDFEDARDQEARITNTCLQDDQDHLKKLIERYNELTSGPRDNKYTVATLRAEIMRYRELLDGVGPRSNRDVSAILRSVFEKLDQRIVIRPSGSRMLNSF
ncbi:hypothetical protein Y032_0016g3152 [Ancylostoma ceylanicum]|uniref:IF rod domain-containing protein n=2 Tax=Ancylostoma ceylanicum TaxID=53326 RepID=A0A016V683_9BILA|nr:hypothetical protein Y032_0016g3152 [Ancylostoma ceylanicum]